jgi:hypothetical protein
MESERKTEKYKEGRTAKKPFEFTGRSPGKLKSYN